MNSKLLLKLFLFFIGIELIVAWIAYVNLSLIFIGIVNTFVILVMFFNFKFDNYLNKLLSYINQVLSYINKSKNIDINKSKNIEEKNFWIRKYMFLKDFTDTDFFKAVKYFFVHYGFVLSVLVLLLSIFDVIIFKNFHLNITSSFLFFIISFLFSYKNLLESKIYFWNRLITPKDIIFLFDITFVIFIFVFLKNFQLYEKIFYSLLAWIIFYIFVIYMLDYTKSPLKLFKSWFVFSYLWLLIISFGVFCYFKIPAFKNYITIKEKVIIEKPVYKEKIVYKEKPIDKKEKNNNEQNNMIIHIAPNWKYYEIYKTTTWAYFTWYKNQIKFFSSLEEAKATIDKYNQISKGKNIYKEKSDDDKIFEVMSAILNDKNMDTGLIDKEQTYQDTSDSSSDDKLTNLMYSLIDDKQNEELTYYKVIPYIVKKFNLSSENKPDIKFKYINAQDLYYKAFKTAYFYKMFGKNTNPNIKVRCQNLAVIIWLANKRNLAYTRDNVFDVFWNQAIKNWYKFDKCCKNKYTYTTKEKISCILK